MPLFDVTPDLRGRATRTEEIASWLQQHAVPPTVSEAKGMDSALPNTGRLTFAPPVAATASDCSPAQRSQLESLYNASELYGFRTLSALSAPVEVPSLLADAKIPLAQFVVLDDMYLLSGNGSKLLRDHVIQTSEATGLTLEDIDRALAIFSGENEASRKSQKAPDSLFEIDAYDSTSASDAIPSLQSRTNPRMTREDSLQILMCSFALPTAPLTRGDSFVTTNTSIPDLSACGCMLPAQWWRRLEAFRIDDFHTSCSTSPANSDLPSGIRIRTEHKWGHSISADESDDSENDGHYDREFFTKQPGSLTVTSTGNRE